MSKKKGDKRERLIESWLQMNGWVVHRAAAAGQHRFGKHVVTKSHDLFGAIDLLAIKRDETWAIQSTTASHRSHRRKKVEVHKDHWPGSWYVSVVVESWERVGRGTQHFLLFENLVDGVWQPQKRIDIDVDAIEAWRKAQAPVSLSSGVVPDGAPE